ncbi:MULTISPECIES: type II toxin-antitoxin system RelE/ParE family toxin [unclassified Pseudomonas]|jgi:Cytotoxic translational repressor of toxin-antitoxin stability system|uniref:type II toxin-antitoxin system RelE family toxin n=1 Tax=Pseudomonas TaxID=286 RepID=UPI000489B58E|nr:MULTISPECIES: type II toxin-antitoxin system RelE/ParE family toxin [unclassified Pseudomonas]ATP43988.1 type II toxin-antitoxin system RelE/ParE family toxin [Pseudomonas putida]SMF43831.1 mRNA interferase RelE/StbE [Pseudomonas sp. LAIL14HWK12:I11]SMR79412.1 mRNA interferase RelE/StbE [Pseudomonas sp. LAIL14HWK12:I10]SOD05307.1 mRNA interferase RelE/StbE [Pseudomonas sp. LAIL14HWK12:I8]
MIWNVRFHPEVENDLLQLGRAEAQRVLRVVRERIAGGEPDKLGKPLRGVLAGCRRIRTGDVRIVYRINGTEIVLVLCIGARRDDEVYEAAYKRV